MATTITTNDNLHSNGSRTRYKTVKKWLALRQDGEVSSTLKDDSKLNLEIHLAIAEEPLEYVPLICDHLFSLYRHAKHRPLVLRFLPSFVSSYYGIRYCHDETESNDVKTKDVCSTIDTFLVSLYNLDVTDDGHHEKTFEFRVPNLVAPSVYHTPNPDHYAPTPLTQNAVSKHERRCDAIRSQPFASFEFINGTTKEQILWFLLIQYGNNICSMEQYSRQSYIKMSNKLLGQGFPFSDIIPLKSKSMLPPVGRRIPVSSRVMSEILGTLYYLKFNSSDNGADKCMRLLKKRAEHEMYSDVLLMTESIEHLHGFESQRPSALDTIGIEIELPPTIDMVQQKRTATTRRSMRHRQHEKSDNNTTVLHETIIDENVNSSPSTAQRRTKLNNANEDFLTTGYKNRDCHENADSSPAIDEARSNISSSIGPVASTPSPSTGRYYNPVATTSPQAHSDKSQHSKQQSSTKLKVKTKKHSNDKHGGQESIASISVPQNSSIQHREERWEIGAKAKFAGDISMENETIIEETYF